MQNLQCMTSENYNLQTTCASIDPMTVVTMLGLSANVFVMIYDKSLNRQSFVENWLF